MNRKAIRQLLTMIDLLQHARLDGPNRVEVEQWLDVAAKALNHAVVLLQKTQ